MASWPASLENLALPGTAAPALTRRGPLPLRLDRVDRPRADAPVTLSKTASFEWPGGARAAVSLTYDDAVATQRGNAARQLGAQGLAGTFFLTGTSPDLRTHREEWITRTELAKVLGKRTLSNTDLRRLIVLRREGMIQMEKRQHNKDIGPVWVYRATMRK